MAKTQWSFAKSECKRVNMSTVYLRYDIAVRQSYVSDLMELIVICSCSSNSIPVYCLILSSHLFFCLPFLFLSLCPGTKDSLCLILLHSEQSKLNRILAILSAIGLNNSPPPTPLEKQTGCLKSYPFCKNGITSWQCEP